MASFKSHKTGNAIKPNPNQDLITNLPDIAIDKILERLPIKTVAKMSVLSKKWRQSWLTHNHLVFDKVFWDELGYHKRDEFYITSCIISNVLFHHVGPVDEFLLYIPWCQYDLNVSPWLSLLSRIVVKKIVIISRKPKKFVNLHKSYSRIPSYIFDCKDLVKLGMAGFIMNSIPSQFKGFAHLRRLVLVDIEFGHNVFWSLIAYCPLLSLLKLQRWSGMHRLVIDVPSLEHLIIEGNFENIVFKNVPRLSFLHLKKENGIVRAKEGVRFIEILATSYQLQHLHFGGYMYKYFGTGYITKWPTLISLHTLHLTEVDLSDSDGFCFTLRMLQCCPFIKDLVISVHSLLVLEVEHEYDYNKNCEILENLVEVKITGLRGSRPELKLIEYLLSFSAKLEKLAFKCFLLDPISELKMTRELLELPRASPKAKVVCLKK